MPKLGIAVPNVFVTDFEAALDFYRAKLGFTVVFTYGMPAYYGQVRRDAALLALRHVDESPLDRVGVVRDELLSAYIEVEGLDELWRSVQEAGVAVHVALRTEPWGMRSFIVRDPSGNLVFFSGP